jgi:hypothetical protein
LYTHTHTHIYIHISVDWCMYYIQLLNTNFVWPEENLPITITTANALTCGSLGKHAPCRGPGG